MTHSAACLCDVWLDGLHPGCPVHGRGAPPLLTDPMGTIEYPGYTEAQLCAVMAESYASGVGDASGTFVAASDMRRMADALSVFLTSAGEDTNIPHRPGYPEEIIEIDEDGKVHGPESLIPHRPGYQPVGCICKDSDPWLCAQKRNSTSAKCGCVCHLPSKHGVAAQPDESAPPECPCVFTEDAAFWNRECFYHGDHGTMVSRMMQRPAAGEGYRKADEPALEKPTLSFELQVACAWMRAMADDPDLPEKHSTDLMGLLDTFKRAAAALAEMEALRQRLHQEELRSCGNVC